MEIKVGSEIGCYIYSKTLESGNNVVVVSVTIIFLLHLNILKYK